MMLSLQPGLKIRKTKKVREKERPEDKRNRINFSVKG